MKTLSLALISLFTMSSCFSQAIFRSAGSNISFFAGTSIEDISAVSTKATSFFNKESGEVVVAIPMTSFDFEQSLMKDHFNENYIESAKYPKAEFKGTIRNASSINWTSPTPVTLTVDGILTLHGVSRTRTIEFQAATEGTKITVIAKFIVPLADHNIDRPKLLWEKLADQVEVNVNITYEQYHNASRR